MKTFSKILFSFTFLLISIVVFTKSACGPPDCSAGPPGSFIPDLEDCHRFYVALDGGNCSDVSFSCGEGQFFNVTACSPEDKPCTNQCVAGGNCTLTCDDNLLFVNDANDCGKYFICLPGGDTFPGECPPDLPYFDGQDCVTDESVCCNACEAQCTAVGEQVPDPYDCRSFYACVNIGAVDESLHGTCEDGDIFDSTAGMCLPGEECTSICEGGPSSGGTTSGGTTSGGTSSGSLTSTSPVGSTGTGISSTTMSGMSTTVEGGGGTGGTDNSGSSTAEISATPSVSTADPNGCVDSYTCTETGNFPKCQICQPYYFHCTSSNGLATESQCSGDLVFNPNPDFPYCILPENCPFNP